MIPKSTNGYRRRAHLPIENPDEAPGSLASSITLSSLKSPCTSVRPDRVGWEMCGQPSHREQIHLGQIAGLRSLPALSPAKHLALDEACRLAERRQVSCALTSTLCRLGKRRDHSNANTAPFSRSIGELQAARHTGPPVRAAAP